MLETHLGGRYRVTQILGAGGFSQTYVAHDTQRPANPMCVVKHLKPASQDPNFLQVARRLFETEAEIQEKLGQHDQIPQLLAYFEENQEFYLVQEYIAGHPLSEELSAGTRLSEPEVIDLLQQILSILEFVHSCQVIHRDIKPSNILRKREDNKLVLIDFGAVKKLQTPGSGGSEQTGLTVGIGTQGYMPNEQLAGKPRFSSDIYALGMTAIQALTGLRPSQLQDDPETSEILWQHHAEVSRELAAILDKMVKYHFRERYQSASEVLAALQQLNLKRDTSVKSRFTNLFPTIRKVVTGHSLVMAAVSLTVMGSLLWVRQQGGLQPLELAVYDQMVRWHPDEGADPRLLIVAITEQDIQAQKQWPISDQALAQLLAKLQSFQPKVVGLNLYRDLPQGPGRQQLLAQLQNQNIIAVTKLDSYEIALPPGVPKQRVGFSDLVIDNDGIVRRNLLLAGTTKGPLYSFSLQVALAYLERLPEFVILEGIEPKNSDVDPNYLQLGKALFVPLTPDSGGYQTMDAGGYQILLNYRSVENVARQVTLTDVLNGKVNPSWIKDRIVLISTTAPSRIDQFYTPYNSDQRKNPEVSGVHMQAQMISQILSAALDKRPLFWFWSERMEILWLVGWGLVGAILASYIRHPLLLVLSGITMLGVLLGTGFLLFTQHGWIPLAAPALNLLAMGGVIVAYQLYQTSRRSSEEVTRKPDLPIQNSQPVESTAPEYGLLKQFQTHQQLTDVPEKLPYPMDSPRWSESDEDLEDVIKASLPTQPVNLESVHGNIDSPMTGNLEPIPISSPPQDCFPINNSPQDCYSDS